MASFVIILGISAKHLRVIQEGIDCEKAAARSRQVDRATGRGTFRQWSEARFPYMFTHSHSPLGDTLTALHRPPQKSGPLSRGTPPYLDFTFLGKQSSRYEIFPFPQDPSLITSG